MQLLRAEIANFRSIKSVTVRFSPRCLVLVGINESGKSNLLRALALLDDDHPVSKEDIRDFAPAEEPDQPAHVRFIFQLESAERKAILSKLLEKLQFVRSEDPLFTVGDKVSTVSDYVESRTEVLYIANLKSESKYWAIWALPAHAKLLGRWKKAPKGATETFTTAKGEAIALSSLPIFDPETLDIPHAGLVDATVGDIVSMLLGIAQDVLLGELPQAVLWDYSESALLPGQIPLDTFAGSPNTCVALKHMFALAGFTNISATITSAKAKHNGKRNLLNRVADLTTEHLHAVWSEYKGVRLRLHQNGPNIEATIEDAFNHFDLSRRSDGFKRFVSFILMISVRAKTRELVNTLYLQDEPEISLHPSGARFLRDELIRLAEANYVVYSTHSIFMIDKNDVSRHSIVKKEQEVTTADVASGSNIADEEVLYNALGFSLFEILRSKNVLFEGWRDKRMFEVATNRVPGDYKDVKESLKDLGLCHVKGVKDISRVAAFLDLAGRRYIVVSDADQVAIEQQQRYKGDGVWMRYDQLVGFPVVTAEDLLKEEVVRNAFAAVAKKHSSVPLTGDYRLPETNRVTSIRAWLAQNNTSADAVAQIVNEIKERLISDLKSTHFDSKYYDMLRVLASHLEPTPSGSTKAKGDD